MYQKFKGFLRRAVPNKYLFKAEPYLRRVLAIPYGGNRHQCNICNKKLNQFITLPHGDLLCPSCGSIGRTRRLWDVLHSGYIRSNIDILDFSPSRCIYRRLSKRKDLNYKGTDLSGDFIADHSFDITSIDSNKNAFDLVICYHVLEHVDDDKKAMEELYRIVKPDGYCLIQTPFKAGQIYEDKSITSPQDRLKHFGQEDHVRIYSQQGLKERLENIGFQVELLSFNEAASNYHGFKNEESILLAKKNHN